MKICAVFTRAFLLMIFFVSSGFTQTLQGAGSTLPYPLYSKWFESYRKLHPEIRIHYRPTGSGVGAEELLAGKVDFAGSDTPLTQEQQTRLGSDVLQIPAFLEAVVPIYHVTGVNTELKFTAAALAGIYLGKITMWSDPEIADANPNVSLPDEKITVVHRSDDNDTTYLWTEFLSRVSPEWKTGPGTGLNVKWPVGFGAKGDDGVEDLVIGPTGDYGTNDLVSGISNSIGYVQLHYAIENRLPYGDVQSATGGFVRAAESSVMAAAASAVPDNFRGSIESEPGQGVYPISSLIWFIVPVKTKDPSKAKAMADFLRWMLKDGQTSVDARHYVKLPPLVVDKAMQEISQIP